VTAEYVELGGMASYLGNADGSAVFQAGGQIVAVLEVLTDEHLPSIVPLAVNAVLSEHQVVIDVITFVARGDFPRSRLGEKQRGKILSHWVTRKLYIFVIMTLLMVDAPLNNSLSENLRMKSEIQIVSRISLD
jgi:hypothetical protein